MSILQELFELSEAKKKKPKCTCDGTEDGDASCKLHGESLAEGAGKWFAVLNDKEGDSPEGFFAVFDFGSKKPTKKEVQDKHFAKIKNARWFKDDVEETADEEHPDPNHAKECADEILDWNWWVVVQAPNAAEAKKLARERFKDEKNLNEGAALKRDASQEGKRQMRIKEILRKLNNKVISKASADKQLRDVGHPGVDLTEEHTGPATGNKATYNLPDDLTDDEEIMDYCKKHGIKVTVDKQNIRGHEFTDTVFHGTYDQLKKFRKEFEGYGDDPDMAGHIYDMNGRSFDSEDGEGPQ